ncbi:MAG: Lrp/AsnC family transcriptional regulator [Gammaproteobacteria bacterium]|nr:Lrp/AsnC family transcriptional regulator [Gammaproteobacteria bacterium]
MPKQDTDYNICDYDSYTLLEQSLLNDFQHNFPLSQQPFHDIAERLDIDADLVMEALKSLKDRGVISRVGPVIKPNSIGNSILAALKVPGDQLIETANMINTYPEVNHNYEREHRFNLWFVITAEDENRLDFILDDIEQKSGYPLLRLPLIDDYHIDLGFDLKPRNLS